MGDPLGIPIEALVSQLRSKTPASCQMERSFGLVVEQALRIALLNRDDALFSCKL